MARDGFDCSELFDFSEKLLAQPVSEKEPVLARYSWEKSAEQLLSLLKEN